jgi:predicted negative regulator of RcsB-dependent stress response
MLLRLAVLGTLGYLGYRQFQKTQTGQTGNASPQVALAGGPLSSQARIQSDPDTPPPVTATDDVVGTTPA